MAPAVTTNEPPAQPAVLVRGLVKHYGDVRALDGLDLEVPRGAFFGLLGPNGAGKTTTLGILTTLIPPTAGRAYFRRVAADAPSHLAGVAGLAAIESGLCTTVLITHGESGRSRIGRGVWPGGGGASRSGRVAPIGRVPPDGARPASR